MTESDNQNISIRLADETDIPDLCHLLQQLFAQEAEFKPESHLQQRGLKQIITSPEVGQILVAFDAEQAIGMVSLLYTVSTALGGRVAILEDMVVDKSVHNKGIGSLLLEQAKETARLNHCLRITLLTDADNERAQRFYQKHGFSYSAMVPMRLLLNL